MHNIMVYLWLILRLVAPRASNGVLQTKAVRRGIFCEISFAGGCTNWLRIGTTLLVYDTHTSDTSTHSLISGLITQYDT